MRQVRDAIDAAADPATATALARYFQAGPGGYGAGDRFVGVQLSRLRELIAPWLRVPFVAEDWLPLLTSPVHEYRLAALVFMAGRAARAGRADRPDPAGRAARAGQRPAAGDGELDRIYHCYLDNVNHVDNWDLVDVSAAKIVGRRLSDRDRTPLYVLAGSGVLWERRIAIVATHWLIRDGQTEDTYRLAVRLVDDPADLVQKAVGWMLREAGKRVDEAELRGFLDAYATQLPRVTLHYAIERLPTEVRRAYLAR